MSENTSSLPHQSVPVDAGTRLSVTYSFHESICPVSDRILVVHHGILHTREHFRSFIAELNALGFHVAMIDQQSESASFRNWIGLGSYATGMAAACRRIEEQQGKSIGGFIYHSMGAAIGEKMQGRAENQAMRLPTVFLAPIPVLGAWPIFTRLLFARPGDLLWAVLMRSVLSLAQTEEDVRKLFFDEEAPLELVHACQKNLKHSPFYAYLQLTFRFIRVFPIRHNEQKNMLVTSDSDYIFNPSEYPRTLKLYRAGEQHPNGGQWLTMGKMPGGHDLFMAYPQEAADSIAMFFRDAWGLPAPSGRQTRVDQPHKGLPKPNEHAEKHQATSQQVGGRGES
ncbi:hypothetical protein C5Y96_11660 [Blastopirellula marina]|uniref:AB hydrolase-1 domain-containing protein n=1 Tax=Blastopirellula marina TaxID=124 RepID=A0A2S8FMS0_9BACT|nr:MULTISPECIES: alpha/beta fold hydrolase [Pirellulaceae]PQO33488.1 hypothetical protein C5Y96_11660 [Blastopirellula marina]RCS52579.1 hypothetical protein DTL36_11670 [Bremerella cremea]